MLLNVWSSMRIQGQFVLETYFVMVIYGLIVCGNIMLIEAGDSKGEVSEIDYCLKEHARVPICA